MILKYTLRFLLVLILVTACKKDPKALSTETTTKTDSATNRIVLISINAPETYMHYLKQDSIGKPLQDSLGPKTFYRDNGFTYLDHMNTIQTWVPKPNVNDTLVIECYTDYLELAANNFFTAISESFLVKNGDTVVFNYEHQIPKAHITNRTVNDAELNYNSYRLRTLFDNKYTSHYMIFGNLFFNDSPKDHEQRSIDYYLEAQKDYEREQTLLDSLYAANVLTEVHYQYRKNALDMLMEKHKRLKNIKKWLQQNKALTHDETLESKVSFDLTKTDSLMTFLHFRNYLQNISQYNLEFIQENNGSSGAFYIDSRIRFDSILADKRLTQTAKNYLLFDAYNGIGQNFKVKDKERYFKKLQEHTTNRATLDALAKNFKLDFSKSDQLLLTSLANDSTTFSEVLKKNKGKWLYIDIWASWCKPCIETMPETHKLKDAFKNEPVEFIYVSLNDKKDHWKKAVNTHHLSENQNYFVENGNVSKVVEDLGIKTIPHYLIYNPNGELVNGFANRPGRGAKAQLKALMGKQSP